MNKTSEKDIKKIIIFASGNGTNAINIYHYFRDLDEYEVTHVFSNKKSAKVLRRAHDLGIKAVHFDKEDLFEEETLVDIIKDIEPSLIVLAGFLLKIPKHFLQAFPNKIINLHPSLLPKYGGKDMYGERIHKKVLKNNDSKSGITIHHVNENFDEGEIIAQFTCELDQNEDLNSLEEKIHALEYEHFPKVIHDLLK
ncbi:phosphoribosylglycinamide formyltransferase [Psychroflexus aestuariivivens]|uniref:phosphoribosylglycinamide formyltransferase n=1 Tax=Psychroflexus aestuariivivens TaxID=1795040 RepID=UPI000FDBC10A|nr:phosphoribosylglycinamide formyltransferase [Psychroflexus aestuariivivens]